jgi:lactoylglutathione lyase
VRHEGALRREKHMADTPIVTGIAHLGIRVHDLDRARAFYEFLGYTFEVGPVGPEPVAILSHPQAPEINLILNANSAEAPNILMDVPEKHAGYTHAALTVADLADAMARVDAAGYRIAEGPVKFPGGAQAAFIRDPDGNVVELNQPPS